jgi:hypothetical protein
VTDTPKPPSNPLMSKGLINTASTDPVSANPLATPGLINAPLPAAAPLGPDVVKNNPLMSTRQPPKTNPLAG